MCARKTAVSKPEPEPATTTIPVPEELQLYITSHTHFAAWILAKARLRYRGCRPGKFAMEFTFDDFKHEGDELLRLYRSRIADPVEPVSLFDSYSFLRNEMRRIQLYGAGVEDEG
jgi:hypothetical protein